MLFPVCIPRQLTALRFTSLLSFVLSVLMVFTIFALCFYKDSTVMTPGFEFQNRFTHALNDTEITLIGIFNSLPLIIFSYMYQPNIPALYQELKHKNLVNMNKVLWYGTFIASIAYIMTGMFGFVTFSLLPSDLLRTTMNDQNILKAPYNPDKFMMKFCQVSMLVVITFASPFVILPVKDSVEQLTMTEGRRFNFK